MELHKPLCGLAGGDNPAVSETKIIQIRKSKNQAKTETHLIKQAMITTHLNLQVVQLLRIHIIRKLK